MGGGQRTYRLFHAGEQTVRPDDLDEPGVLQVVMDKVGGPGQREGDALVLQLLISSPNALAPV